MVSIEKDKKFEKPKDSSGNNTIQRLELFRNCVSVRFVHAFIGYSPTGTEDDGSKELVDRTIVRLTV